MLSLNEQIEVYDTVEELDAVITDDILDKAEYYEVEEDPVSLMTVISLFDEDENELISVEVEDFEVAVAYIQSTFDVSAEDIDGDGEIDVYDPEEGSSESLYGHTASTRNNQVTDIV